MSAQTLQRECFVFPSPYDYIVETADRKKSRQKRVQAILKKKIPLWYSAVVHSGARTKIKYMWT